MEKNQPNNKMQQQIEETLSMRNELEKYLYHWKWFVLCVFSSFYFSFFLSAVCHAQIRGKNLPSDQTRRQYDGQ